MKTVSFSCPGLGASLVLNDASEILGGGFFGPGFDRAFRTLTLAPEVGADGTRGVMLPSADGPVDEWPDPSPYLYTRIGSCVLALSADGNTLDVAFTLNRYALGWPPKEEDFGPHPTEADITGSVTLSRLA